MDHHESLRSRAAERYIARELSAEEQDAFEAHFFDCPECAEEVRLEQAFVAHLRALFKREENTARPASPTPQSAVLPLRPPMHVKWLEGVLQRPFLVFSLAANFALVLGVAYLLTKARPRDTRPQFIEPYFAPGPAGAAGEPHAIGRSSFYVVHFPPPVQKYSTYSYEILGAAGNREQSSSDQAPDADGGGYYLEVPVQNLPAGEHTLVIRGDPGGEVLSQSRFLTSR
jgi:hypothetical protein